MKTHAPYSGRGFVLFEAMLAVAIFALGALALGRCVENCLKAEMLKEEDERARRILEGRMLEIEAGAEVLGEKKPPEELKMFPGWKIATTPVLLKAENERKEQIQNIYDVTLTLSWQSGGSQQVRTLEFYANRR